MTAAPFWNADGQSILVVAEKTTRRTREFELVRCALDPSEPTHVLNLVPDPVRRVGKLRGVAIDFDKDAEVSCYAADLENRDSELVWTLLRDSRVHRRIDPIDPSLRIGALSVSPDGRSVAIRFGDPDALSHPALHSIDGEQTTLLVPDESSRRDWLKMLSTTAAQILKGGLPPLVVGGESYDRPTVLPLPGELAGPESVGARLAHIARLGGTLLPAAGAPRDGASTDTETRLLFDYLRGDIPAALADIDVLDQETTDFEQRLSILSIRALIRWAQGDLDQSRQVIAYLVANTGTATERIEDTPLGPAIGKVVSPQQAWAEFLSVRAAQAQAQDALPPAPERIDPFDPFVLPGRRRLLDFPEFPVLEPGGAGGPFAPMPAPDLDPAPRR